MLYLDIIYARISVWFPHIKGSFFGFIHLAVEFSMKTKSPKRIEEILVRAHRYRRMFRRFFLFFSVSYTRFGVIPSQHIHIGNHRQRCPARAIFPGATFFVYPHIPLFIVVISWNCGIFRWNYGTHKHTYMHKVFRSKKIPMPYKNTLARSYVCCHFQHQIQSKFIRQQRAVLCVPFSVQLTNAFQNYMRTSQ